MKSYTQYAYKGQSILEDLTAEVKAGAGSFRLCQLQICNSNNLSTREPGQGRWRGSCGIPSTLAVYEDIYKRSTVNVFKAHGAAQAHIADCVTETFSAIRTVRSFGGEKHQMSMFGSQVHAYQNSGIKLGIFKSLNESLTRVAVYVSLMALYCLGGSKVKAGELSVGTVASFIGYTFTLTFAVQGLVNTFGDLRGAFAATERINIVLSGAEVDESLTYGLKKDVKQFEM